MIYLILLALVLVTYLISPHQARVAASYIARGFLIPTAAFLMGTVGWLLLNLFTGGSQWTAEAWLYSCSFFGLPASALLAAFLMSIAKTSDE